MARLPRLCLPDIPQHIIRRAPLLSHCCKLPQKVTVHKTDNLRLFLTDYTVKFNFQSIPKSQGANYGNQGLAGR